MCKDHTALGLELIDDALKRAMPGDFTLDSYFTSAKSLNHIQSTQCAYVGDLQLNRQVVYAGREQKLQEVAWQSPWEAKKPVRMGKYTVLVLQQTQVRAIAKTKPQRRAVSVLARALTMSILALEL